jgi:hypothetical protein
LAAIAMIHSDVLALGLLSGPGVENADGQPAKSVRSAKVIVQANTADTAAISKSSVRKGPG